MKLYTETTDGSYIESKESALVWHHQDADPDFGSCQAKELLDHLESVLANEPVVVKSGQNIVEVKPPGVSKGLVVEKLLSTMSHSGKTLDFLMCIGDDHSDEDMFESISNKASCQSLPTVPETCMHSWAEAKQSKVLSGRYCGRGEIAKGLAAASTKQPKHSHLQVSFESFS